MSICLILNHTLVQSCKRLKPLRKSSVSLVEGCPIKSSTSSSINRTATFACNGGFWCQECITMPWPTPTLRCLLHTCMNTFPMTTSSSSLNTVLKTTVTLSFLDSTYLRGTKPMSVSTESEWGFVKNLIYK